MKQWAYPNMDKNRDGKEDLYGKGSGAHVLLHETQNACENAFLYFR